MAAMSAGYFQDEMPLLAAPNSIPMAMDDVCQASLIMKEFLEKIPEVHAEAADLGIRPIFFHVLNPYLLVTKHPVTQLSDLKGMRIRSWGNEMADLIRSAGGKPVPLFLPDLKDAFKHDVIDGCPFSVDLMVSYKLHEIARHITEVTLWEGPSWGIWIGAGTWGRLSADEQAIFIETAEVARQKDLLLARESEIEARQYLTAKGVEFHPFPESQIVMWKKKSPDFFIRFVDQMDKKGKGDAAKQMVDIWKKTRKDDLCNENDE
jgi:TRAP-type C4-dicarboxylate transport system substrate-binding protein